MFEWYENPIIWFLGMVALIIGLFAFRGWRSAEVESNLYNQKYGTSYTQREFFWGGETIKSFLNGGEQTTQNIRIDGALPVVIK